PPQSPRPGRPSTLDHPLAALSDPVVAVAVVDDHPIAPPTAVDPITASVPDRDHIATAARLDPVPPAGPANPVAALAAHDRLSEGNRALGRIGIHAHPQAVRRNVRAVSRDQRR